MLCNNHPNLINKNKINTENSTFKNNINTERRRWGIAGGFDEGLVLKSVGGRKVSGSLETFRHYQLILNYYFSGKHPGFYPGQCSKLEIRNNQIFGDTRMQIK